MRRWNQRGRNRGGPREASLRQTDLLCLRLAPNLELLPHALDDPHRAFIRVNAPARLQERRIAVPQAEGVADSSAPSVMVGVEVRTFRPPNSTEILRTHVREDPVRCLIQSLGPTRIVGCHFDHRVWSWETRWRRDLKDEPGDVRPVGGRGGRRDAAAPAASRARTPAMALRSAVRARGRRRAGLLPEGRQADPRPVPGDAVTGLAGQAAVVVDLHHPGGVSRGAPQILAEHEARRRGGVSRQP